MPYVSVSPDEIDTGGFIAVDPSDVTLHEDGPEAVYSERPASPKGTWEANLRRANEQTSFGGNLYQGLRNLAHGQVGDTAVGRGAEQAVLGLLQASRLLPEESQKDSYDVAHRMHAEGAGTGASGALGEMVGDYRTPLTALAAPFMGTAAGSGAVGALYGATNPAENEEEDSLSGRAKSSAGTAAAFAALPPVLEKAGKYAKQGVGSLFNAIVPQSAQEKLLSMAPGAASRATTPAERTLETELPKAAKGTLFKATPNQYKAGLEANQAISKAYHGARSQAGRLYDRAEALGAGKLVPDEGITDHVDNLMKDLVSRQYRTLSEDKALAKLQAVRSRIGDMGKSSTILDAEGSPIKNLRAGTIGYNDLVDLKKALNEGFKSNQFGKAGDNVLSNLSHAVDSKIQSIGKVDPQFVDAINSANSFWKNKVARIFRDNSEIDPLWQPEDYFAWTEGKMLPATQTRANKFLQNLNGTEAGRLSTIIQALPPEEARSVLRNAYTQAARKDINVGQATRKLATGHPLGAAETFVKSFIPKGDSEPIINLAKDLKNAAPAKNAGRAAMGALAPYIAESISREGTGIAQPNTPQAALPLPAPRPEPPTTPVMPADVQQDVGDDVTDDEEYLRKTSMLESGGNPNAQNTAGTSRGLYGFTTPTWRNVVNKYGKDYGVKYSDRGNPEAEKIMASLLTRENRQALQKTLGRNPEGHETYLAHFLGADGARRILENMKNVQVSAARLLPDAAQANQAAFFDNGRALTPAEFVEKINKRYGAI